MNKALEINNKSRILAKESLEIKIDSDYIYITVNQRNITFELSKKIRSLFKSIIPTSKLIILDLSKIIDLGGSFRLIIINMLLSCKNNGVNLKIIHGQEGI